MEVSPFSMLISKRLLMFYYYNQSNFCPNVFGLSLHRLNKSLGKHILFLSSPLLTLSTPRATPVRGFEHKPRTGIFAPQPPAPLLGHVSPDRSPMCLSQTHFLYSFAPFCCSCGGSNSSELIVPPEPFLSPWIVPRPDPWASAPLPVPRTEAPRV